MVCPYCGKESIDMQREHYFPQSVTSSDWDFYACKKCNKLKSDRIIYPLRIVFKKYPVDFDVLKFKELWSISPLDKYLYIVPASNFRHSIDNCTNLSSTKIYSYEERAFYGLDTLKDMYLWCEDFMLKDRKIQSLVISYSRNRFYLLHTYRSNFITPYRMIESVNVFDYVNARMKGALVLGNMHNMLHTCTSSYVRYFKELCYAPSNREMIFRERFGS